MRDVRERGQRHGGRAAQVHVGTGQDGHVTDRQRLGEPDQQCQSGRQPGPALDALQPRGRHAGEPGQHRPAKTLALAQDLDTLAGPLPGKVIEHQLTSGSFRQLLTAYAASHPASQGTQTPPPVHEPQCAALTAAERFPIPSSSLKSSGQDVATTAGANNRGWLEPGD
jgi:hypothetical protein